MSYRTWVLMMPLGLSASAGPKEKPPPPPPPPPASEPPERLGSNDIMQVIVADTRAIHECARSQKARDPNASGRVIMKWIIRTDGKTQDIKCVPKESKESCKTVMADCITGVINSWRFPRAKKQGDPIEFPFRF